MNGGETNGLDDIQQSQDGNMRSESIIELCGPLTDVANAMIDNIDSLSIRVFPEVEQEQLVQMYVEAIAACPT